MHTNLRKSKLASYEAAKVLQIVHSDA